MNIETGMTVTGGVTIPPDMLKIDAEDLTALAVPPHAEPMPLKAEDLLDEVVMAPALRVHKPRDEAFADRVAKERAEAILGADFEPVVAGMIAAPKKVGEKAYNALCYLADRGKLSVFTDLALGRLSVKGSLKVDDLVEAFKADEYSDKTARSQAQQQMTLLPILKVAMRAGSTLELLPGNMLELFKAAAVRVPEPKAEKAPKVAKARKSKEVSVEAILEGAPLPVTVEETVMAHNTSVVEELLVGSTEPAESQDLTEVAAPAKPVKKMSAEEAIEAFAAEIFEEETKTPAKKRSKKKAH